MRAVVPPSTSFLLSFLGYPLPLSTHFTVSFRDAGLAPVPSRLLHNCPLNLFHQSWGSSLNPVPPFPLLYFFSFKIQNVYSVSFHTNALLTNVSTNHIVICFSTQSLFALSWPCMVCISYLLLCSKLPSDFRCLKQCFCPS